MGARQPYLRRVGPRCCAVVFGPLGIVASMVAFWKGARWWGAAGVSGSAVAAVVGYYMADSVIG